MNWFNVLIWDNIYSLRTMSSFFIISLFFVLIRKACTVISKKIKKFACSELILLYINILKKHIVEKFILISILMFITLVFLFFYKNSLVQSMLGVVASAIITVLFLDSINQYISEKKFINVSKEVRNTIYSLYYSFCEIILVLDNDNLSQKRSNDLRNSQNIIQDSISLYSYCEKYQLKHNKELSKDESDYANHFLQKLKDDIEVSIQNINNSSPNIEIYEILFLLNNLYKEFKHTGKHFFTIGSDAVSHIFGGINDSLLRNSLKQYNKVLKQLESNNILKCLHITYKKEIYAHLVIPPLESL